MGYIYVQEHFGGGQHIDADWSPTFEDLYSLELDFMDIYVISCFFFMLQLHKIFGCTYTTHCALQLTIEC